MMEVEVNNVVRQHHRRHRHHCEHYDHYDHLYFTLQFFFYFRLFSHDLTLTLSVCLDDGWIVMMMVDGGDVGSPLSYQHHYYYFCCYLVEIFYFNTIPSFLMIVRFE